MNPTTSIVLALALPSLALAQQVEPQTAWAEFQATNGSGWTAQWNPATGTPKALYGPGLKLGREVADLGAARRESTALLNRFSALLGRGQSTFVENIGVKARQVYILVYDQKYRGLDVISGRADVRIHEIGTVAMFGSSAIAIPNGFDIKPVVTAIEAQNKVAQTILGEQAKNVAEGATQGTAPRLVIWGDTTSTKKTTATLAWEVQIDARPAQLAVGKAYIDAKKGTMLEFKNEVYECSCGSRHVSSAGGSPHIKRLNRAKALRKLATPEAPKMAAPKMALTGRVMAWINPGILPSSPLVNVPMPRLQVTSSAGNAYTDANGDFSIPYTGSAPVTVTARLEGRHCRLVRIASGTQRNGSASVTPGTAATIQIGSSTMGERGHSQTSVYWHVDDANVWLRSLVGNTGPMDTISAIDPRVNIESNCNAFYTSNTINFYTSGGGCNMTAFQTVIVHEWGHGLDAVFGGISQTDGLSEGWGDLLAIYRSRQPELGPGFRTGTTNGIRTGLNTRTYPAGGGVHTAGQTWMGWAWDLRGYLMTSLGNNAGEARAHEIVVASIAANARNQPDAVREVFILDDDDGNLNNGTPNYLDLERASIKRTLPYPRRTNPNAAAFSTFGNGCRGTGQGPSFCVTNNQAGGTLSNTTAPNEYAYQVINTAARSVSGFEIYTASSTGSAVTVRTAIYAETGGAPGTTPVATGMMTIGTTPAFYRSTLSANLPAGNFYVSVDHSSNAYLANLGSGTAGIAFWRRPPMGGGTFSRSGLVSRSAFRVLCAGGGNNAIPQLSNDGLPEIGRSFDIKIEQGLANAPATLLNGLSNTIWGGGGLPFSLAPLGAPGCDLLIDPRWPVGITLNAQGAGKVTFAIPNVAANIGIKVYHQYYVIDAGANALNVAVTGGGESKIGQR